MTQTNKEQVKEPAREISTVGELVKLAGEMSNKSDPKASADEILFELAKIAEYGGSVGGQINAEIIEFSDDERNKLNRYINKIPH